MCSNRNELWNTSLLFDLNYKFELIGASLLALAKSIYYTIENSPTDFSREAKHRRILANSNNNIRRGEKLNEV